MLKEGIIKDKDSACDVSQYSLSTLLWLHTPILRLLVRISFSDSVPFRGEDLLLQEREGWIKQAERRLDSDLRQVQLQLALASQAIVAEAKLQLEDVTDTMLIRGKKEHSVGLVLAAPSSLKASSVAGLVMSGTSSDYGCVVERLLPSGAAQRCGMIHPGDILVEIYGKPVHDELLVNIEQSLRGARGSCVSLIFLAAVSLLPYEVELQREGGVRLCDIMRLVRHEGDIEIQQVKEKYARAIKTTRDRIRLGQYSGIADTEQDLLVKMDRDISAVLSSTEDRLAVMQGHLKAKSQVILVRQNQLLEQAQADAALLSLRLSQQLQQVLDDLLECEHIILHASKQVTYRSTYFFA